MLGNAIQQSGIGTPPPPPVSSYYVAKDGQTTGPFQMQQIQEMMLKREISDQTYVYKLGGTQWVLVRDEPELSRLYTEWFHCHFCYIINCITKINKNDERDINLSGVAGCTVLLHYLIL